MNGPQKSATVLVVEDERDLADLFAMWLSDEYDVRTAYTGTEAVESLDPAIDVVLLDRRLPDIPGDEVLGRIRERGLDCRVAMVTAVDPDVDLLKLDIDEYVTKPVSKSDLKSVVGELTTRNALEADLRTYQALVSKKKAIEGNRSLTELRSHRGYEALTSKISDLHEDLRVQLGDEARYPTTPWQRYSHPQFLTGIGALGMVAVLLLLTYLWVPNAPDRLFSYGSPRSNPLVAYLALFAHISPTHLYGNVGSYLVASILTYVLCVRLSALRWFYLTTALLFTVLPLGVMLVTYGLFDIVSPMQKPMFVGFSHVVSGFVGFSFLAFLALLRTIYDSRSVLLAGGYVVSVAASAVLLIHGLSSFVLPAVGSLLLLSLFIVEQSETLTDSEKENRETALRNIVGIVAISGLYAVAGIGLVPAAELEEFPGTLGHLVGLGGGFSLALMTALFLNVFPIRDRIQRSGHRLPDRVF